MLRPIAAFHRDADGDWVAELSCWHTQHVRHQPPFRDRPWVLDPAGRAVYIGTVLDCPPCERAELPGGLDRRGSVGPWDEAALPEEFLRAHLTPPQLWGVLRVHEGDLGLQFRPGDTPPGPSRHLSAGSRRAIPPGVLHRLILTGPVRVELELWGRLAPVVSGGDPVPGGDPDEGGDPACWAGLLCPGCGAVLDGGPHRVGCGSGGRVTTPSW
ncbi:MAG: DUF3565 domain-containing protein [Mycobacteriales bacterium]